MASSFVSSQSSNVFKSLVFAVLLVMGSLAHAGNVVALAPQEALQSSAAAQAFRQKVIEETQGTEKQVLELETQARDLQSRLQVATLPAEEAQRLELQFKKVYAEYQRQAQALQQTRAQQEQQFIAQMRPKLDEVIRQLIEERDISVILNRQSTIYMEAGVDITPEVVKRLDAL